MPDYSKLAKGLTSTLKASSKAGVARMAPGGLMKLGKRLMSGADDTMPAVKGGTRKFGDGRGGLNIIKEPNGNWLTNSAGSVENALQPLKRNQSPTAEEKAFSAWLKALHERKPPSEQRERSIRAVQEDIDAGARNEALNNWVERNLTNYVKKQMGTADDPVRKLAEEGVIHIPSDQVGVNRYNAGKARAAKGQPQLGKSEAAKAWEDSVDTLIYPARASEYTMPLTASEIRQGSKSLVDTNPWLTKVAPETSVNAAGYGIGKDLGFDHIMDVLRADITAGRIRPEQLNKVSMEQAVRRTHEFDQDMAKQMREAQIKATEGMPTHKEYPEGYKWVELAQPKDLPKGWTQEASGAYIGPTGERTIVNPSRQSLEDALKYEGQTMGHCVGSYCDEVAGGQSRIYSLRDAKGEPHVTIETSQRQPKTVYTIGSDNYSRLAPDIKKANPNISSEDLNALVLEAFNKEVASGPPAIKQIKGKQNAAPNTEYLPFVQDFVKSGKWSDVGDLQNTGLRRSSDALNQLEKTTLQSKGHEIGDYLSHKEIENLQNTFKQTEIDRELARKAKMSKPFTEDDIKGDWTPEGMAEGGAIHMQVGGLSALAKLGKAGTTLSKAEMAGLRARGMGVPGIDFADPLNPKDIMRMSEALGAAGSEGKTLNLTQADRSRVFGPNKGGTGFSGLQLTSEPHQQAGTTWGVGKPSHVTRMTNANTPETVWSTFIGSPTQHMSNPVTVERMYEAHKNAGPSADLIEKMNKQLNSVVNPKTKKPIFPDGIDISDPASLNKAQTFDQRKAIAQAMTIGGEKKGEKATQEAFKIIKEETDPLLTEAPTYAVGNRLFTIDKDTGIYRPDLNKAFPEQTTGTDFGLIFDPAPVEHAAPDFVKKFEGRLNKHGNPQAMGHKDLTATTPKQFISEEYLTNLQKEGYQDGGSVNQSFSQRLSSAIEKHMAGGGVVNMSDTTPDNTDSGNIIPVSFYAKGGQAKMSLRNLKPRHYAEAGYVDPLGAPDYQSGPENQRLMELAGGMIRDQAGKEGAVLSTPQGRRDIALKVASHMPGLGMGGDLMALADWVQTLIPGMYTEKPTLVMESDKKPPAPYRDTRELQRIPKFKMQETSGLPTSEKFQEKFKERGWQGENEAPVTEFIGTLFTGNPSNIPKAARGLEGGLNSATAAARRPFTPAVNTVEAVSPDLAKFKPSEFQEYATKQMIGEGSAMPMSTMGGRKTSQRSGQGMYLNEAGELEMNPMLGISMPRAGNLATNKALRADMATAGQELGQEAMAAHRFLPMATNNIKDASAMMIKGPNGRPLTNQEVIAMGKELPGMIATHSPANGGLFVAPFGMTKGQVPQEFLTAQAAARRVLGKDAKIQFGKADEKKDLMYMPREDYTKEGGRGTSQGVQDVRKSLKRMDQNFPSSRN